MILSSELKTEHKRSLKVALQTLFFVGIVAEASSVRAQELPEEPGRSSVELTWIAPEQCPDRPFLIAEIEKLVGRPLNAIDEPSIKATATITKKDIDTWVLRLRTRERGVEGERELVADNCDTLAQAAALILALSIDPEAVETRERLYEQARRLTKSATPSSRQGDVGEREEEASEKREIAESREMPADDQSREMTADRRIESKEEEEEEEEEEKEEEEEEEEEEISAPLQLGVLFRSGLVGDIGTLPDTSIGADVAVGLSIESVDLIVSITWLAPNQTELAVLPEFGAQFGLWTFGLGAYYRVFERELSLAPCVIIDVGNMYGKGRGVDDSFEDSALWFSMTVGFRLMWKFTDWAAAGFQIGPKVPFFRPRYVLEISGQSERVHRSASVALSAHTGIELRL